MERRCSGTATTASTLFPICWCDCPLVLWGTQTFGKLFFRFFNAHRVHDPEDIARWFAEEGLELVQFTGVDDSGTRNDNATPADVLGKPASKFVADFVGADRGLKRLSVTPIDAAELAPPPPGLDCSTIEARVPTGSSLKDALAQLLLHDAPWVAVFSGDECLGVLTAESLHAAMRHSLATAEAASSLPVDG